MFAAIVPAPELASVAVGAYPELEMLSYLEADRSGPEALFAAAAPVAVMIDASRGD